MNKNFIDPTIRGIQPKIKQTTRNIKKEYNKSFGDILDKKIQKNEENVVFSKHANQRFEQRNIKLTETEIEKISDAINRADEKGIKNSLIMMDDIVLIANIKSRTIVTAVDSAKDKVFTNVDGVVSI